MANKKKSTKSVTKDNEKKEKVIKDEKLEKKDLEEEIDDDELDIVDETEEDNEEGHVEVVDSFNLNNEIKGLKILTCVSICISIVSLLISLIILSKVSNGVVSNEDNGNDTENSEDVEYDVSMFKSISYDEFLDMYEEDEEYFVFTGRSTCGYCVAFLPYLQQSVEEYDYTLYYLDIDTLTNDQISDVAAMDDGFSTTFGATPMVYLIKDKEVVDVNQGYTDYETYATFLDNHDVDKNN